MGSGKTEVFDVALVKKEMIVNMLKEVSASLEEKGYNSISQIVGYIISGEPGYISNYNDSRNKIRQYDRTEILAVVLKTFLEGV